MPDCTVPPNEISLAVIVIGELVEEIDVPKALVTVAQQPMVTPLVPEALAFNVMPAELAVDCKLSVLPDMAFDVVILPFAVSCKRPVFDFKAPLVVILAFVPVVVICS